MSAGGDTLRTIGFGQPELIGRVPKGYRMIVTISPPGAGNNQINVAQSRSGFGQFGSGGTGSGVTGGLPFIVASTDKTTSFIVPWDGDVWAIAVGAVNVQIVAQIVSS